MPSVQRCSECGTPLAGADAPDGLCPQCLLQLGLEPPTRLLEASVVGAGERDLSKEIPGRIGEYRVVRLVGRGGMGVVYEAYEESMQRTVALKVLDPALQAAGIEASRFEREAWIGGRLAHPNIVKVYRQGMEGAIRYIAMEFVHGPSLHQALQQVRRSRETNGSRDSEWRTNYLRPTVELFVGVADALHYVHEQGVLHRDIKPGNLLFSEERDRLFLTDFGLARDDEASRLTRKGDFFGTIRYMSPEQLLAARADIGIASDIYSLGVSLYEAVTLELPYSADSEEAYITAISSKEPVPARARVRSVPRDLETVLMKCLERDPEQRYESALELKKDLERFLEDRPVRAIRPGLVLKTTRFTRRHRRSIAGSALAIALSLGLGGLWVRESNERQQAERLRWTLEQVIETGNRPETIDLGWSSLEEHLRRTVQNEPTGPLALLAIRAACTIESDLPSFGLASEPPEWEILHWQQFEPGPLGLFAVGALEASLDGSDWVYLSSASCPGNLFGGGRPVDEMLRGGPLPAGPHRIELRARFVYFDTAKRPWGENTGSVRGSGVNMVEEWPELDWGSALHRETREVKGHSINLFESFADGFPRAVASVDPPVENWLSLRLRIFRAELPPDSSPCVRLSYPLDYDDYDDAISTICAEREPSVVLTGIRVVGEIDRQLPVPLAGRASIYLERAVRPILGFDFAIGAERVWIDGLMRGGFAESLARSEKVSLRADGWDLDDLPSSVEDGSRSGRLELRPSREVALETRWLDSYLEDEFSLPVEVEVLTLDPSSVELKSVSEDG